jgi:uncharacterized protein YerC
MNNDWVNFFGHRCKPEDGGCIVFSGYKSRDGYGQVRYNKNMELAHRASYQIAFGKIPDGSYVCHHCDNPACINPLHIYAGSQQDNMNDKVSRRRQSKGEHRPCSRLTERQIVKIRIDVREYKLIAADYKISVGRVSEIKTGKAWGHISSESVIRGRAVGERHPLSKINDEIAIMIRRDTRTSLAIAKQYGVSESAVSRIKRGITWKHLNANNPAAVN